MQYAVPGLVCLQAERYHQRYHPPPHLKCIQPISPTTDPPIPHPRCTEIASSILDPLHHRAALMHVAIERAEAVVIICLPCAHNDGVAAANVVRLDPPSQGVALERSQPISLDVGLTDMTVHFGGVEEVRGGRVCAVVGLPGGGVCVCE